MPGPVSDSYDPEFGTRANAQDVMNGIQVVIDKIGKYLGPGFKYIVDVAHEPAEEGLNITLSEREMRLIRFGLNRAKESI